MSNALKRVWVLVFLCGLLVGCAGTRGVVSYDLRRGQGAVQTGNVAAAEYDLVPLAQEGYLPAMLELARLYVSLDAPYALKKAAYWYRAAIKQDPTADVPLARVLFHLGSPKEVAMAKQILFKAYKRGDLTALATLIDLFTDNPEHDPRRSVVTLVQEAEKIHSEMMYIAVMRWYRKNRVESAYTKILISHCREAKDRLQECYVDMARHYRQGGDQTPLRDLCLVARTGYLSGQLPLSLLVRMADVLVSEGVPGDPFPEMAYAILRGINTPDPTRSIKLADLLVRYPHLDPNGNPERLLSKAAFRGSPEAALDLGLLYMNGKRIPADPVKAESYLKKAARTLPQAHYFLGWFYKRGYRGHDDPVRAAEHFLIAARRGYAEADDALAQLFSDQRGARENHVYAVVFSNIAASKGIKESQKRLDQLKTDMSQKDQKNANLLLLQEQAARGERDRMRSTDRPTEPIYTPMDSPSAQVTRPQVVRPGIDVRFKLRTSETVESRLQGEAAKYLSLDLDSLVSLAWTPNITSHMRAQAFLSEPNGVPSEDRHPSNSFLALREFWVAHSGFTSYPGEAFRLGLQRVKTPNGLWWEKEIESVRWVFDTTQVQAHIGVAERFGSYRSDHQKPALPPQDRTYLLAGLSRQWRPEHVVGIRGTAAVDHADLKNRQLNWFSVYAENGFYSDQPTTVFSYWVEGMGLMGSENLLRVDSQNHVIGVTPREILSEAFDVGLRVRLPTSFPLQLGMAGAYAQGGEDNSRSHLFVQTGLQSNRSRFTGTQSIIHRFNDVIRADLSNISVATLFLSLPLLQGDASVILSHFERNNVSSPITTTGLSLSPLTNSGQIGNGLDLVLTRRFDAIERATKGDEDWSTHVRLMASLFQPGMLYGNQVHDLYKMMLEVTLWF